MPRSAMRGSVAENAGDSFPLAYRRFRGSDLDHLEAVLHERDAVAAPRQGMPGSLGVLRFSLDFRLADVFVGVDDAIDIGLSLGRWRRRGGHSRPGELDHAF